MASPPAGYLKADGSAVGRETYPDLFCAIGTSFGSGDNGSTFSLPDLIDRFAEGSLTPGLVREAGLPNITGKWYDSRLSHTDDNQFYCVGALYGERRPNSYTPVLNAGTFSNNDISLDASLSNPVHGASETVQPPSLTLLPCIKAFDAATNPGLIDVSALAGDMNARLDKSIDGKPVHYVTDTFSDGTNRFRK